MKKHLPIVLLTLAACFCLIVAISIICSGCQSKYGRNIPAKEMAIYNAESRIRLLEHYDKENNTDINKAEITRLNQQIAGLKKAIEEEKKNKKEGN